MDVRRAREILIVCCGAFHPTYELPISQIKEWKFVAEENGATYLCFSYPESEQHVSVSSATPEGLQECLQSIEAILNMAPIIEINESRVTKEQVWLATDVTIGVLGALLAVGI
tara:strand:- start:969 stop:1307 length:339 start_codon:yes stop_codon:yes gene_type:complete